MKINKSFAENLGKIRKTVYWRLTHPNTPIFIFIFMDFHFSRDLDLLAFFILPFLTITGAYFLHVTT